MRNEALHGIEFLAALDRYLASMVEARDYAAAVKCFEDHRSELDAADGALAGSMLRYAAKAYASMSDYPAALRTARLAQNVVAAEGDSELLAEIFLIIGGVLRDQGVWKEAEKAFRDAESIFRRKDCVDGQCRALNLLAGMFYHRSDFHGALSVLMDAVEIAGKLDDRRKLAFMLGNIGRIETFLGRFSDAERHLQTNIDLSRKLRDRVETARAYMALGYAYIQQDKYREAEDALTAAQEHLSVLDKRHRAIFLIYRGELCYRLEKLDEAAQSLEEALRLAEESAVESTLIAQVMRHLAELSLLRRRFTSALRYASRSLAIINRVSNDVEKGALLRIRAIIAEAGGQSENGRQYYREAIDILDGTGVRSELAAALTAAGRSQLFNVKRRLTYLFRAEELYRRSGVTAKVREVERFVSEVDGSIAESVEVAADAGNSAGGTVYLTECCQLKQYKAQIPQIARSGLPLLLTGETGVGKDQMARYYHSLVRPNGPFVAVNCASIPESLLESELFGYRKGAFTGADFDKPGLLASANGGVLYLDEIGDMPPSLQAKLLGVLERRRLTPLGSTEEVAFDIKLVVATNRDLECMVAEGSFRRDLYYRLSGITFRIPPLRERKEDIPLLLQHFMSRHNLLREGDELPRELRQLFLEYDWPGNIRELENKVRELEVRVGLVAEGDLAELTRSILVTENQHAGSLFDRVEQFERKMLVEALIAERGNKSKAARRLGIHEATVRAKAKRYGITITAEGGAVH